MSKWLELSGSEYRPVAGSYEHASETSYFIKYGKTSLLADRKLASQEWRGTVEVVSQKGSNRDSSTVLKWHYVTRYESRPTFYNWNFIRKHFALLNITHKHLQVYLHLYLKIKWNAKWASVIFVLFKSANILKTLRVTSMPVIEDQRVAILIKAQTYNSLFDTKRVLKDSGSFSTGISPVIKLVIIASPAAARLLNCYHRTPHHDALLRPKQCI